MGVVQQDGEPLADGHQLHAALDHALAQALVDGLIRQAQHLAHGQGGQGVVHAELTGHVHFHVHIVLAGDMELHAQKIVGAEQLILACTVISGLAAAIGHQLAGVALQQGLGVGVVDVDHADIAPLEQLAFPAAVFLKGLVFTGADMVRRKVGEDAHMEVDARHTVHHQALAGDFHQCRITARVQELAERLLQLIALGRGVGRLLVVAQEVDAVGADHAHLAARGFQHALDHVGGGGLALGARHTDHGHLAGGVAEQIGAHFCHGVAAALHLDDIDVRHGREVDIVLDDQRIDALCHAVGGKIMAVPLGAHDTDEQQAGRGFAAVVDDILDFGLQGALHEGKGHILHQLFQFHK